MIRIGIDLGGTKTEIVVLDETGGEAWRRRIDTPRGAYEDAVGVVADLIEEAQSRAGGAAPVALGHPGFVDPESGLLKNAFSTVFSDRDFRADLSRRVGRDVRFENDANCFALSEAIDGAGAGHRTVFGIILGTGAGAGLVVDGRIHRGPNRIAGEWGHVPLPWMTAEEWPGPECPCGRRGCIELFVSGTGLARDHALRHGRERTAEAIWQGAASGDAACVETLERHRGRLARSLAVVIDVLDPDVIVLGGGLSRIPALTQGLADAIAPHAYSRTCRTPIVPASHGDASGVRGAAWLAAQGEAPTPSP
jgi:fructokinase